MDKNNLILCFIHRFMHILREVGDFESTDAFCNMRQVQFISICKTSKVLFTDYLSLYPFFPIPLPITNFSRSSLLSSSPMNMSTMKGNGLPKSFTLTFKTCPSTLR